jgi:hypothetical protein
MDKYQNFKTIFFVMGLQAMVAYKAKCFKTFQALRIEVFKLCTIPR